MEKYDLSADVLIATGKREIVNKVGNCYLATVHLRVIFCVQ